MYICKSWYMVVPVQKRVVLSRVAEVGSLSARAIWPTKIFVKSIFAIFVTNASFLRVIANFQILVSMICNIYHVIVHLLPKKHCC